LTPGIEKTLTEPYNSLVRACFASPRHAGELHGQFEQRLVASVGDETTAEAIAFSVGVAAGKIGSIQFRARGCPHFIAGAEYLCREMLGKPVATMQAVDVIKLTEPLAVPIEKFGKMLILEDALRALGAGTKP